MILPDISTPLLAFAGGSWILTGPLFWLLLMVGIFFVVRGRNGDQPWTRRGR
jgi:hypothetical protein